mmetsp:Transcript_20078/g.35187  ORF Transcript_20078/g.35187 Transcript_20078/m.35187 type:complete len:223 (+) Transcript_20078:421-1089(+)
MPDGHQNRDPPNPIFIRPPSWRVELTLPSSCFRVVSVLPSAPVRLSSTTVVCFPFASVVVVVFLVTFTPLITVVEMDVDEPNPPPMPPPKLLLNMLFIPPPPPKTLPNGSSAPPNPPPNPPRKKLSNGSAPPKKDLKISSASLKLCTPVLAPPVTPSLPYLSYASRFSLFESTSYASAISLNISSASSLLSGFLSGCHCTASFLYAFLIAPSSAERETPSSS